MTTTQTVRITVGVLAAISIVALLASPTVREWKAERKCGREHAFTVSSALPFLPDALALAKARDALAAQGFDTNRWLPETYSQTKAPDGTPDRFLCRNVINDYLGVVTFTNRDGRFRRVHVALSKDSVVCVVHATGSP